MAKSAFSKWWNGNSQPRCWPTWQRLFVMNLVLNYRWDSGVLSWYYNYSCIPQNEVNEPFENELTLKELGGQNPPPPLDIFCYISAGCYFFALKLHDFFPSSIALNLRPFFLKIGPRVMMRRCVIERWVQQKLTKNWFSMEITHKSCFLFSGYTFTMFYLIYLVYLE